jgi:hypothetical protein
VAARSERPSEIVYSSKEAITRELRAAHGAEFPFRSYSRFLRLLSVVGPYVSIGDTVLYSNPGTYVAERFRVVDLRVPGKPIQLTDLFPERVLVDALIGDSVIKRALGQLSAKERPKTVAELAALLRARAGERQQGKIYFPEDWLTGFALHHLEGGRVAIRVALPFMSGMREETVRHLGLLLPRPAALDAALDDAAARRAGFLMKDTRPLAREAQTRVSISAP